MATIINYDIDQGTTFERLLEFSNADGSAMDLTGCILRGQLRENYDDPVAAAAFEFEADNLSGTAIKRLTDTITSGLAAGTYLYDIELQLVSGKVLRIIEGKIKLHPEVTKNE